MLNSWRLLNTIESLEDYQWSFKPILWVLAIFFFMLPISQAASISHLQALAKDRFILSAEIQLLNPPQLVAQYNAKQFVTPASLAKLYVAAAALVQWGPQHRFKTRFTSRVLPSHGVLNGNLYLDNDFDPSLSTQRYWMLVQSLAARGIKEITGQVILSQANFQDQPCMIEDRCKALNYSHSAYNAAIAPLALDSGAWCVEVQPTQLGQLAYAHNCLSNTSLLSLHNTVKTVNSKQPNRLAAQRVTHNGQDQINLSGQIALNSGPQIFYRSAGNILQQTQATLQKLFQQAGIHAQQGFVVSREHSLNNPYELSSITSPPLQMILMDMMNYSNNFMADMLTTALTSQKPASLASGTDKLVQNIHQIYHNMSAHMASGSGLTPESKVSADDINQLLTAMYQQSDLFPSYVAALQLPSNGVARYIRRGDPLFQRSIMVKTGTLNEPVPVRAIAGYFRTKQDRWGSFAVIFNGYKTQPYLTWPQVLQALSADLTPIIEKN